MKKFALHLIYLCVCLHVLMLASCRDDDAPRTPRPGLPGDSLQTTLIFYIAGENSLSPYMSIDTLEIAQAMNQIPEDARVVVLLDDTRSTSISVGTRSTPLQCVRTFANNVCTTDSAEMLTVLRDIMTTYPARHYALSLNSHASGWVFDNPVSQTASVRRQSWGVDNGRRTDSNQGRKMDIPTLARVLARLPHLDYILFDACFMQCVEVAYELRHVTDYVIGSPAEIPADGAPYQLLLPLMCRLPANDVRVDSLVQTYADFYISGPGSRGYGGVELSAIATLGLDAFAEACRPVICQLFQQRAELDCADVQRYCPIRASEKFTEFYDFGHLVSTHAPEAYAAWHEALERVMPARVVSTQWLSAYNYAGSYRPHREVIPEERQPQCAALSVFVPSARYEAMGWLRDYQHLEWYRAAGLSETGW